MSGVLICLDMPEGCMFGIDLKCWRIGSKFRGLREVPTGAHFVYCSAIDSLGNMAISSGINVFVDPHQVWIARWDSQTEQLAPIDDRDEASRYIQGFHQHDFDFGLGPYPLQQIHTTWLSLSRHISKHTLARIEPIGQVMHATTQQSDEHNIDSHIRGAFYLRVRERVCAEGTPPQDVTALHLDKTALLEKIVREQLNGEYEELLGELQFSFNAFVFGQSYEGFEQWKSLVLMICSCERALSDHRNLYLDIIDTLSAQLEQAPEDFFSSDLSSDNFLHRSLRDLFELGEETSLASRLLLFRQEVEKRFGCSFSSEPYLNDSGWFDLDNEDAPTIVEL